jgi:hypothetical protein
MRTEKRSKPSSHIICAHNPRLPRPLWQCRLATHQLGLSLQFLNSDLTRHTLNRPNASPTRSMTQSEPTNMRSHPEATESSMDSRASGRPASSRSAAPAGLTSAE